MLARRGCAAAIDVFLLGLVGLTVGALVSRAGPHSIYVALAVAIVVIIVGNVGLQLRSGARHGQTLGKQVLNLCVTARDDNTASPRQIVIRELIRWPLAALMLYAASHGVGAGRTSLHDKLVGTKVQRKDGVQLEA